MAGKSVIWMFVGVFCTLIQMYVVLFVGLLMLQGGGLKVNAQGADAGARFLDQKELEVMWIAGNASLNDGDCGSLASCRAECSRATCHPLSGEPWLCISSDNSEFYNACPSEDGCRNTRMLVDYSKSFVTLPVGASTTNLQTEVARDICLQRRLDSTFKTVSIRSNHSEVYFGSTSGAFRSFPGRELSDTQCVSFDSRLRPWYLNGISVSRDVKILVDVANSMDQLLSDEYKRPPGTTYLDVAKNMTLALLQTFSPGDNLEVFPFSSTNATSLGGAVAVSNPYSFFNSNRELTALMTNVTALAASSATGASDLNGAILRAAGSFNQIRSLKVIIVLSNGLFVVNSTTFPSAALQTNRAKLLVYKLPTNFDGGDTFLQSTPFQKDICSVQGSFELLDALATLNPLYSMRSYFTYLAGIQLSAVGGNVTWTSLYSSVSQKYTRVIPTYPAFGRDGLLLGVAGTDIFLNKLDEPLRILVLEELSKRSRGSRPALANISMTCYYQTNIGPANSSCPPLDSSGICPQNDTSSTLAQRTCCGTCSSDGVQEAMLKQKWFIIVIALIANLLGIFILGVLFYYKLRILMSFLLRWWQQPVEEDLFYLNHCECIVKSIKSTRKSLNEKQCSDLSSKLLITVNNVSEIILCCGASANVSKPANHFQPALVKLYVDLKKAKLLVEQCGKKDWCRESVFQIHNEIAFQEIILDVSLCYNAIYEQAKSLGIEDRNLPEDLRQSSVFTPASQTDVFEDQIKLRKRLEDKASSRRASLKQCLAKYLVERLDHPSDANTLDTCSTILWAKENVPTGIWEKSHMLGSGSGASGVYKAKWVGIKCAKKEFHVSDSENMFLKEANISAHLKHPCVVNFICCGNGERNGDRFIAMELMEKNLFELIEDQRAKYFSLPVVVDIMVQIARGMCYLHGQGVAHRDLKPHNVVVNILKSPNGNYYCVKLVDFGMAKTKVEVLRSNSISFPGIGTTRYRAPEVPRETPPNGEGRTYWFKADVYSFAMTCAHMLSLSMPFENIRLQMLHRHIMDEDRPMLPNDCPEKLKTLLRKCWSTQPCLRPSFTEILTTLEAFRFKILTGCPTDQSHLEGIRDEFIKKKIKDYTNTFRKRQLDANHMAINSIGRRITRLSESNPPTGRIVAPPTSIEMTQNIPLRQLGRSMSL